MNGEKAQIGAVRPPPRVPGVTGNSGCPMDIVLGDQYAVFLDALTAVLFQAGHRVLAVATTVGELIDSVRTFQPEVCLLEPSLPDSDGIDVVASLLAVSPGTKVVMLTADRNPETMHRALRSGAVGYVHKTCGAGALMDGLARIAAGEIVIEGLISRPERTERAVPPHLQPLANHLTKRELECLALLVEGLDTNTMARRLCVSATTIRSHVQAVLNKLGAHTRLEAASLAVRYSLIDPTWDVAANPSEKEPA
jgi:two-component system nitrate/nitrite response regulator NarL